MKRQIPFYVFRELSGYLTVGRKVRRVTKRRNWRAKRRRMEQAR